MLPDEYLKAILVFKHTLGAMGDHSSRELRLLLPRSPPYRGMFSRISLDPACGQWIEHEEIKSDVKMRFFEIITDFSKLRLFKSSDLTDEIERAIEEQPGTKRNCYHL